MTGSDPSDVAVERAALPPAEAAAFDTELRGLLAKRASRRLWDGDPRLYTRDAAHDRSIATRLGWLRSPDLMRAKTGELRAFAAEVHAAGFRHVVLLGMGGSSLCPEVLVRTFGVAPGGLPLHVLDNTDPAAIAEVESRIDLGRTLFLVASKSGGTIEIKSFAAHFWQKLAARHDGDVARTGEHFVAITDPETALSRLAAEQKYRRAFLNPADIGGRYSAVSYFGFVPAALLGIDLDALAASAVRMTVACGRDVPAADNPGVRLGAIMGALAKLGRDKVTLLASPGLQSFGSWIEQLIAESTGKLGGGIVPVDLEPPGDPGAYGPDRLFVRVRLHGDEAPDLDRRLDAIEQAGHPVVRIGLGSREDLGGEFVRWEVATAIAGACLDLNPFDEPNVTEAKIATGELLAAQAREGSLPSAEGVCGPADAAALRSHLETLRAGDYLALCAYFVRTDGRDAALTRIRTTCRARTRNATTLGYGPRFLHSTGQLHKGGANNGVFVQITANAATDLSVPGEVFSFATLRDAQALGDLQVLRRRGRRALRVHLGRDVDAGLAALEKTIAGLA